MTFSCHFHFGNFPFDTQQCRIELGDLLYTTQKMELNATCISFKGFPTTCYRDDPIIISDLPYPYDFELTPIPPFVVDFDTLVCLIEEQGLYAYLPPVDLH